MGQAMKTYNCKACGANQVSRSWITCKTCFAVLREKCRTEFQRTLDILMDATRDLAIKAPWEPVRRWASRVLDGLLSPEEHTQMDKELNQLEASVLRAEAARESAEDNLSMELMAVRAAMLEKLNGKDL